VYVVRTLRSSCRAGVSARRARAQGGAPGRRSRSRARARAPRRGRARRTGPRPPSARGAGLRDVSGVCPPALKTHTQVDPHPAGREQLVDDPEVVHHVLCLCGVQPLGAPRGCSAHRVDEEARQHRVPRALVLGCIVHLLKVACRVVSPTPPTEEAHAPATSEKSAPGGSDAGATSGTRAAASAAARSGRFARLCRYGCNVCCSTAVVLPRPSAWEGEGRRGGPVEDEEGSEEHVVRELVALAREAW
jgi:hypothetical protein